MSDLRSEKEEWEFFDLCESVDEKNTHTPHVSFCIRFFKQMLISTLKRAILDDNRRSGWSGVFNEGLWLYGHDFLLSHMSSSCYDQRQGLENDMNVPQLRGVWLANHPVHLGKEQTFVFLSHGARHATTLPTIYSSYVVWAPNKKNLTFSIYWYRIVVVFIFKLLQ